MHWALVGGLRKSKIRGPTEIATNICNHLLLTVVHASLASDRPILGNAAKTSGALGIDTTNGDVTQWAPFTHSNLGSPDGGMAAVPSHVSSKEDKVGADGASLPRAHNRGSSISNVPYLNRSASGTNCQIIHICCQNSNGCAFPKMIRSKHSKPHLPWLLTFSILQASSKPRDYQ